MPLLNVGFDQAQAYTHATGIIRNGHMMKPRHAFLFPSRYSEGETPSALLKSLLK